MARETPSFRVPGAGHWKLVAEREPAARPSPFGGETSISWAPALPGPHSIGEAPSDAGFMLYHVGDTLCFFDQRGAKADSTDTLQLRDRVLCHDLHWSCPPPGAGAGSSSANGGGGGGFGGASLEALVGLSSGEVVLWRPFSRRETSRGLSSAVAGGACTRDSSASACPAVPSSSALTPCEAPPRSRLPVQPRATCPMPQEARAPSPTLAGGLLPRRSRASALAWRG
ncbi:hypothetical protein EMIHUDRAFT_351425 [Emiliania huxleyi CCMP1516]|uniref:Uncharacterized protein n=2 Tax=Emiliania huxleyi TaxID=2903 RepID=A0A0D3KUR5_EMIH1|nr:hypothetical protein EMIHUDRAFT_351425 [Emiliania huxleyi CCMP1516]EOD39500.1 hypothetical protein EMIHUDRAFT_351425 [Emiliania huxleyi CCMP1516]|eukprot:XP_005791929.1 hypothetical protein EMIHUDRAFT_351425 [Emiliania huxleyi CCMP1516]